MILAIALQSDIKSIGAYCGFAAIVGLALLVLLYFSQARELRRMADRLEEQEERMRRMPAAAMARSAAVPQPAPQARAAMQPTPAAAPAATVAIPGARRVAVSPIAAEAAATQTAAATAVSAPAADAPTPPEESQAGVETVVRTPAADPATTPSGGGAAAGPARNAPDAAETAIPTAAGAGVIAPATAAGAISPATPAASAGSSTGTPGPGGPVEPADPPPLPTRPSSPPAAVPLSARRAAIAEPVGAQALEDASPEEMPPGTVAVGGSEAREDAHETDNGRSSRREATSRAWPPAAELDQEEPALAPATAAGGRPRYPPAPPAPRGDGSGEATVRRRRREDPDEPGERRHTTSTSALRLLGVAIVIVGVLIFVASRLLASSPAKPSPTGSTGSTSSTAASPPPSSITVAVLNGTTRSGLASRVSATLASEGFRPGTVANAPSRDHAGTAVDYAFGARNSAIEVADKLALTPAQVRPVSAADARVAAAAGSSPTVVVILGANYAQP